MHIGRRHYLLLPKMTLVQMGVLERRLASLHYSTELSDQLTARSREGTIHISSSGVCWSAIDPTDAILPALPNILTSPKEQIPLGALKALYFEHSKSKGRATLRISTRIESYNLWDELRASGGCGLAPDEHAMASFLMRRAAANCEVLTDFPTEESTVRVCGRRRYYDSRLDSSQAANVLRSVGGKALRSSYLHRDGFVTLGGFDEPSPKDWTEVFEDLGEWCYFAPKAR